MIMYLEWAPMDVFVKPAPVEEGEETTVEELKERESSK